MKAALNTQGVDVGFSCLRSRRAAVITDGFYNHDAGDVCQPSPILSQGLGPVRTQIQNPLAVTSRISNLA